MHKPKIVDSSFFCPPRMCWESDSSSFTSKCIAKRVRPPDECCERCCPVGPASKWHRRKKNGIEKRDKKYRNKQGQALSWSDVNFYRSEKNGLGPSPRQHDTPWKFNIAPENKPSGKDSNLPTIVVFQGQTVKLRGCSR